MTIYITTLIFILIYGSVFLVKGTTKQRKILFLCIAFLHLWIVMAMRSIKVGNDTKAYYIYFLKWGSARSQIGGATQPIYYLYNRLIYAINHSGQAIIICNSFLEVMGIALFIYYFSENVFLSTYLWVTLYFFCESMNIARQFLALSLFMIAFIFLWKKNNTKLALLFFALAIGTHNLTITLAPVFLVKLIKLTKKKIYAFAAISTFFIFLFDSLFSVFINVFCHFFPYYAQYLQAGRFNVYREGGSRNVLLILFYLLFVGLALFLLKDKSITEKHKDNIMLLLVPCIITVAIGLGAVNIISVQRIKVMYSVFFICMIPNTIACLRTKTRIIAELMVMLITILPFAVQLMGNYGGVVPYSFFWQ